MSHITFDRYKNKSLSPNFHVSDILELVSCKYANEISSPKSDSKFLPTAWGLICPRLLIRNIIKFKNRV